MLRVYIKFAVLALTVTCLAGACAPETQHNDAGGQAPAASGSWHEIQLSLPLPSQLPASGKSVSDVPDILRGGKDFEPLLPNNKVIAQAVNAAFAPAWGGASKTFDALAFCMYEYHPVDYSYNAQIRYHWDVPLTSVSNGWIGLANWAKDRWDWYPMTAGNRIDFSSFAPYFDVADSNRCIVTVVCCGTDPAELSWIRLGSTPPVAAISASKNLGLSPVNAEFDPAASYDPDTVDDPSASIVKYEWDLEPDGVFEVTTTTPELQTYLYSALDLGATFNPELRVTDSDGLTSSTTASVYVLYPWTHAWGDTESETITAVTQDDDGNIYATGYTMSYGTTTSSVLVIAYAPDGTCLWKKIWFGASWFKSETGTGIAADGAGNLIVVGKTTNFGAGNSDALIQKWTTGGELLWTDIWGGTDADNATAVAVADSGIYVMGTTCSWDSNGDAFYLKFDPDGELVWEYTWGGAQAESGTGLALAGTAPDTFAGVGTTNNYGNSDAFSFRFNEEGTLWEARVFGDSGAQIAKAVAVDPAGGLYIAGQSWIPGTDFGLLLYKLDNTGNPAFSTTWDVPGEDCISSLARQADGSLWAAGYLDGSGAPRAVLASFDSAGSFSNAEKWYTDPSATFFSGVLCCPYGGLVIAGKGPCAIDGIWDPVSGTEGSLASATLITSSIIPVACSGTLVKPAVPAHDPIPGGVDDTGGGKYDLLIMYHAP